MNGCECKMRVNDRVNDCSILICFYVRLASHQKGSFIKIPMTHVDRGVRRFCSDNRYSNYS